MRVDVPHRVFLDTNVVNFTLDWVTRFSTPRVSRMKPLKALHRTFLPCKESSQQESAPSGSWWFRKKRMARSCAPEMRQGGTD